MKRLIKIINRLEEGTLAVSLLALAFLAFYEAVQRYFFNHSFTWFEELFRYSAVFITFLGASLGVKYGSHFSMDFFVNRVSSRTAHFMGMLTAWISAALFLAVSWFALLHCQKLVKWDTMSAAMKLPMYWAYAPITLFSFTLAVRFVIDGARHLGSILRGEPLSPVAGNDKSGEEPAA